jgi:predicted RNA binding protein YcfA (HicA-like mRNA interferase family)
VGKFPALSGADLVSLLKKEGFQVVRQKGSHVSLRKGACRTVIPLHDDLAKGTLLGILKQCGLTREELMARLKK